MKKNQLMLSTWFYKYLMEQKPAGLPNEIFTKAPHTLLLFDEIICDKNGFEAEKKAAEKFGWTASEYFVKLEKQKIIKLIDSEKELADFLDNFNKKEKEEKLNEQKEFIKPYTNNKNIESLNKYWDESPFGKIDDLCLSFLNEKKGYSTYKWDYRNLNTDNLILRSGGRQCLNLLIPQTDFIPSFEKIKKIDPLAYQKFQDMQKKEEILLINCKLGELSEEEFFDWRIQFSDVDEKVDDILKEDTKCNFDILMKMREKTKKMRHEVCDFIVELQNKTENDINTFSNRLNIELNHQIEDLIIERKEERKMIVGELIWGSSFAGILSQLFGPVPATVSLLSCIKPMYSKIKQFEDGLDKKFPLARYKNKLKEYEFIQTNIDKTKKLP